MESGQTRLPAWIDVATDRKAETGGSGWEWGGRVDLLMGTDCVFTTARGLDASLYPRYAIENVASWAFIGGAIFKSEDGEQSLAVLGLSGNELSPLGPQPADGSLVGNRTLVSTVYTNSLTDRLTYVVQGDTAWQFNSALPAGNLG